MTVITEGILSEMRLRNIERAKEAAKKMGDRYLLHPSNRVIRKDFRPNGNQIPNFLLKKQP